MGTFRGPSRRRGASNDHLPSAPDACCVSRRVPRHRRRGRRRRDRTAAGPEGHDRRRRCRRACAAGAAAASRPGGSGRGSPTRPATRRYLVCNGAEGEPGTFKDRALLRANPYQVVEGVIIAAFAVGADGGVHLPEGELRARDRGGDPRRAGVPGRRHLHRLHGHHRRRPRRVPVRRGEGDARGDRGQAAAAPLVPAVRARPVRRRHRRRAGRRARTATGRRGDEPNPTLVNNVETLANVPHILARGADWFRSMGTAESPGHVVATVVGDVVAPDVGEVELGTPLRRRDRRRRQRRRARAGRSRRCSPASPTRSSPPAQLDVAGQLRGLRRDRQRHGRGRVHRATTTRRAWSTPRTGSRASSTSSRAASARRASSARARSPTRLERIETGAGDDARPRRHRRLARAGHRRQPLLPRRRGAASSSAASCARSPRSSPSTSSGARCPRRDRCPMPKLLDLADGVATYDESFWRKRPDWTYEPG